MNIRTTGTGLIYVVLLTAGLIALSSCAKKDNKAFRLLTSDSLSTKEIDYFKSRELFDDNEKIIYAYTMDNFETSGTILTTNKVALYTQESVTQELFENIFDMKKTHSLVDSIPSKITITPKEQDEFTAEFKGGSDADEKFFDFLRDMWRTAISSQQEKSEPAEPKKES